ncbi:MAG: acyl-CoA thioesterase [Deltaproteobacteria bacterium]|nr:acyl-CoA thioesterase [Deltaproteobacteria bacterium]MBN2671779.1 acyl-CoA thioesterase [Deltaproteobacteria bacterium]
MSLYRVHRMVKLQDIDAAGIVFFSKFLEYCHDAYFEFMMKQGIDLPTSIATGEYILPLVHTEADFKGPLKFGDEIVVAVERVVKGTSSYSVHYSVHKAANNSLCCTAQTVHAAISRTTFKPLKQVPPEIVAALHMNQ